MAETTRRQEPATRAPREHSYVRHGVTIGSIGAFVVAFYFLIVDVLAGHPLATPTALGSTLFLGERFSLNRTPSFPLVLAYTAVHGVIFIGLASVASTLLLGVPRHLPGLPALAGLLFAVLFVALTATFLCFAAIFDIGIWSHLGGVQVTVANLLAAGVMAFVLASRALDDRREAGAERGARGDPPHAEVR